MSSKLVIMESPTKSKTVASYLGKDYLVLSSDGHIRDLATKGQFGLGIDFDEYTPIYKTPRAKMPKIKELKSAAKKADHVYLATDHDREGEAIAYHLDTVLETGKKSSRVTFNEITKDAILTAMLQDHQLDLNLVNSQQARQMLDRMIGFRLSNLLQKKIGSRSAGRVQSVALKLIANREREITSFIPEEYWTITADYQKFILTLEKYDNEIIKITNAQQANEIKTALSNKYQVISITKQNRKRNSLNPLTTSTMLQAATKLNFSTAKTTFIAQQLYEGIDINGKLQGFISYPRSDSIRLNASFIEAAQKLILDTYGQEYLGQAKKTTNKKNVQDAHEAIRPTDLAMTPKLASQFLNKDQLKLYQLIYQRTLSSLMAPARLWTTTIWFDNKGYQFKLSGQEIEFKGFLIIDDSSVEKEEVINLPSLKEHQVITTDKLNLQQNFTKPKARYSEARLIKTLEDLGIGRPSTYSPILNTIQVRGYVILENKAFKPTEKGLLTNDKLQEFFYDIINENYTSQVEKELDSIAQGNLVMNEVVKDFWLKFEPRVENAFENMTEAKPIPKFLDEICPKCQEHLLVERVGRYGKFIACSGFPKCNYIKKEVKVIKPCPECQNGNLVIKSAKGKRKFLGCTNYPECKHIEKYQEIEEQTATKTVEE
ncbi:MAG: type I DNA topoisomerase [Spiroplasma sp.]|nr:type I DNA topoisomerase [Spiroplasma sp.]